MRMLSAIRRLFRSTQNENEWQDRLWTSGYDEGYTQATFEASSKIANVTGCNMGTPDDTPVDRFAEIWRTGIGLAKRIGETNGYRCGHEAGCRVGRHEGYDLGYVEGHANGCQDGWHAGTHVNGFPDGWSAGWRACKMDGSTETWNQANQIVADAIGMPIHDCVEIHGGYPLDRFTNVLEEYVDRRHMLDSVIPEPGDDNPALDGHGNQRAYPTDPLAPPTKSQADVLDVCPSCYGQDSAICPMCHERNKTSATPPNTDPTDPEHVHPHTD